MADLRKRFGKLVAAHRKRRGMTQAQLAEAAELSPTMIVRIENGSSGARFPSIERIAGALGVDPAELFTPGSNQRGRASPVRIDIDTHLAPLTENDLSWINDLLTVALRSRR
jgi:transcriptional regulator with XRE-family HTH domain